MSEACCGGDACAPVPPAPRAVSRWQPGSGPIVASSGLLMAGGAWLGWNGPTAPAIVLFVLSIGLSVPTPARRAARALRARSLDINVLMLIAVVGAAILGDWLEAAAVVWLFGIAQWLESLSLDRARRAIRQLMTLAPTVALVRRDGVEAALSVDRVQPGDIVIVRPGERVPVDGRVSVGESEVDQSPITGESWPVDKRPGDLLFAGTINGSGVLEFDATRPASDSTLARIIHLVEEAQARRAPIQTFVDRFARKYTPAVVLLAILVALVPPIVSVANGGGSDFATWTYRALTLLVVACPCALVISTPVSIMSALTAAARSGVLIKGGAYLERLAAVKTVAFDKTGTLTAGRISVTDVVPAKGMSTSAVLAIASALEHRSEHPIGRAIVARASSDRIQFSPGAGFRALAGLGAEATVNGAPALVGSHRLFEDRGLCTPDLHASVGVLESRGRTPVLVGHRGIAIGALGLSDHLREGGRSVVDALRAQGIEHIVLLTGDRPSTADQVRDHAGLDDAHADLMPEDKVAHIRRLRERYGPVAMVGDGINDAPALAAADVGIAMGVAGTDVAIETADVALLTDSLEKLPYAVRLGRATLANIRFNVAVALGLKLAFVGLAMMGVATLWMAILADTGASMIVTASSLRLLRVR